MLADLVVENVVVFAVDQAYGPVSRYTRLREVRAWSVSLDAWSQPLPWASRTAAQALAGLQWSDLRWDLPRDRDDGGTLSWPALAALPAVPSHLLKIGPFRILRYPDNFDALAGFNGGT